MNKNPLKICPALKMELVIFLLVALFSFKACNAYNMKCKIYSPVKLQHTYCESGDVIIGGIATLANFLSNDLSFTEEPQPPLLEDLM